MEATEKVKVGGPRPGRESPKGKKNGKLVVPIKAEERPKGNSDQYGFRIGSASSRSAELIAKGGKLADMTKVIMKEHSKTEAIAKGRVLMIVRALARNGKKVTYDKATGSISLKK